MNTIQIPEAKTSLELPAWFKKYNAHPCATSAWIKLRVPGDDLRKLLSAQKAWNEVMRQRPARNPHDQARSRSIFLNREYERTKNAALLDEIGAIGHKGSVLEDSLRQQLHTVRRAARKVCVELGLAPLYANIYKMAFQEVMATIAERERAEKEANSMLEDHPWTPSQILFALANLADLFRERVLGFSDWQNDTLECPRFALEGLWEGIVANNLERKNHK